MVTERYISTHLANYYLLFMKGSPILSTITATLLMAGSYLWLHLTLYSSPSIVDPPQAPSRYNGIAQETLLPENMINCYIEAHFSTPPSKFIIKHPVSGKIIVSETNLTGNEWSGEIKIARDKTAELNVYTLWDLTSSNRQNFLQLVLFPDQMEDSSVTLRSHAEIDSTATFQLRK